MTPARRKTLQEAVELIRSASDLDRLGDDPDTFRAALIRMGARFVDGNTNTMRLEGVTASCTWDKGEQLILRWAANARAKLAEGTDANGNAGEEE